MIGRRGFLAFLALLPLGSVLNSNTFTSFATLIDVKKRNRDKKFISTFIS